MDEICYWIWVESEWPLEIKSGIFLLFLDLVSLTFLSDPPILILLAESLDALRGMERILVGDFSNLSELLFYLKSLPFGDVTFFISFRLKCLGEVTLAVFLCIRQILNIKIN